MLDATMDAKSHHFSLLPSSLLLFIFCSLHLTSFHRTMFGKTHQASLITGDIVASGSKAVISAESEITSASSSSNVATQMMVKKEVTKLFEYWKAPTISKKVLAPYHSP
jgi:hypothetical protein